MIQKYVAGFMFDEKIEEVLLILKEKPDWQKGYLNGIGGKIEEGEKPLNAMIREFQEETSIFHEDWDMFCTVTGSDWVVYFYRAFGDISKAKKMETETPIIVNSNHLPTNVIDNLNWLIPMAKSPVAGEVWSTIKKV